MIQKAKFSQLNDIIEVYREAQQFMRETGNPTQWGNSYPDRALLEDDIRKDQLFIVERNGKICGAFVFFIGDDPWYAVIDDGCWADDSAYGVLHRVAGKTSERGIFKEMLEFAEMQIAHLRIDTHADNAVMQHILLKNGFERRGIVYVHEHSPRIAFERLK